MKTSFNIGWVKVAQFQKTIFVTTFFCHCNVLSPKTLAAQIESL
jgi:hypothetical protein